MRGKLCTYLPPDNARRITPAHAGKTPIGGLRESRPSDHPRACGENNKLRRRERRDFGSPPRMRGKLVEDALVDARVRITPAHAGKTFYERISGRTKADHPRACGENRCKGKAQKEEDGSPPRMRGKPLVLFLINSGLRITPAHAGKTRARSRFSGTAPDHPRACGENFPHLLTLHHNLGSPPRMRGKHRLERALDDMARITPAHAGKTLHSLSENPAPADHPRACGENSGQSRHADTMGGSPPRMRGKHI